jgi:hypothetical protein
LVKQFHFCRATPKHKYAEAALAIHPNQMTPQRSNSAGKEGVKHRRRIKKGLAALLLLLDEWDDTEDGLLETLLRKRLEITTIKKDAAKNRTLRQRTRECFEYLCQRIIANVGEGEFKSEEYLNELKHSYVEGVKVKDTNIANDSCLKLK